MFQVQISFGDPTKLTRLIDQDLPRSMILLRVDPPADLEFRSIVRVDIVTSAGSLGWEGEVLSVFPGVGVGVTFPSDKLPELVALRDAASSVDPEILPAEAHEIVGAPPAVGSVAPPPPVAPIAAPASKLTHAEKIQLALHGTKDDRATILRDQNKQLHAFVLKSPLVTPDELIAWAKDAQMSPEFLKLIGDKKEWISRQQIAQALAKNPKTPAEVALKALEYVSQEMLRQMAKGVGAPPHVVQAARKKIVNK